MIAGKLITRLSVWKIASTIRVIVSNIVLTTSPICMSIYRFEYRVYDPCWIMGRRMWFRTSVWQAWAVGMATGLSGESSSILK